MGCGASGGIALAAGSHHSPSELVSIAPTQSRLCSGVGLFVEQDRRRAALRKHVQRQELVNEDEWFDEAAECFRLSTKHRLAIELWAKDVSDNRDDVMILAERARSDLTVDANVDVHFSDWSSSTDRRNTQHSSTQALSVPATFSLVASLSSCGSDLRDACSLGHSSEGMASTAASFNGTRLVRASAAPMDDFAVLPELPVIPTMGYA
eukprot:TRINITY_DN10171_c1_g1_i1.p2 TRINITY_DN10171_c1_g1~~TRINITY_DN10171_c1_g1_i1.p2  ORF type:complete len:208 (+),score=2.51 TRINITY_DN10171_c1_g1_i1:210-833(+)